VHIADSHSRLDDEKWRLFWNRTAARRSRSTRPGQPSVGDAEYCECQPAFGIRCAFESRYHEVAVTQDGLGSPGERQPVKGRRELDEHSWERKSSSARALSEPTQISGS